ncbi:hypothetical protein ACX3O0_02830 [Homoserinimonas sp. A447]
MTEQAAVPPEDVHPVPLSMRAQLLATEHWSLLASRSTTQSEVLTRINMFLTLVSAGLVSLALVGQATGFSDAFIVFAVVVLGFVCLVGVLTQLRVMNVGLEDLGYVLAMNRLRAAYVDLDPGVAPYLMTSQHDDLAGSTRTYYFLGKRSAFSHVAGSSMVFISVVNAALGGLLVATITGALAAPALLSVVAGFIYGLTYFIVSAERGRAGYLRTWDNNTPLNPTPPE